MEAVCVVPREFCKASVPEQFFHENVDGISRRKVSRLVAVYRKYCPGKIAVALVASTLRRATFHYHYTPTSRIIIMYSHIRFFSIFVTYYVTACYSKYTDIPKIKNPEANQWRKYQQIVSFSDNGTGKIEILENNLFNILMVSHNTGYYYYYY